MGVWVFGIGGLLFVVSSLVEFRRRVTRFICLVSDLVMGAEFSAFYSGGRFGHWAYVLRDNLKLFYGIYYKAGSFVYVSGGGNLFGIEELVEVERVIFLRVSSVLVALLV